VLERQLPFIREMLCDGELVKLEANWRANRVDAALAAGCGGRCENQGSRS
jgi:hypothetical protein